jgi:RNA polymerase sigma-70 factor (ECF subfamily)
METSSWEAVYRREHAKLWRSLLLAYGDRSIASDAVSEAFAQGLHHAEPIRDPEAWIWRTAYLLAKGELQRRGHATALTDDAWYEIPELSIDLASAMSRLPQHERAALILHYYGGYSGTEIAKILGVTTGTTWVYLSRGRKRLRRALEVSHAEPS